MAVRTRQADLRALRLCVFGHIPQCLLRNPESDRSVTTLLLLSEY